MSPHPSKVKGDRFERLVADYLAETLPAVERIPAGATEDRGDLWIPGSTIQIKNVARMALPSWWADTTRQAATNRHALGWLVHKRVGTTAPGSQWVTCDLAQLRDVLGGAA